jgi:hypothetical protein
MLTGTWLAKKNVRYAVRSIDKSNQDMSAHREELRGIIEMAGYIPEHPTKWAQRAHNAQFKAPTPKPGEEYLTKRESDAAWRKIHAAIKKGTFHKLRIK